MKTLHDRYLAARPRLTDIERECRGTWLEAIALSQLDLTYRDKLAWSLCTVPTEPEDDGDDKGPPPVQRTK